MLLKELNLIGFGKFKNKNIILEDGINLIYGENEAGKSTLHSFIDGMFYGFLKPNVRSTLYLEEHDKYNPWDKNRYAGIIRFEYNGKRYRLERDFAKGEESTKILEETTGVDITRSIDSGSGRVLQPGIHFFGFNTRVFSNTISIKQLGTKTDDKLANEVTEKLINVTTALDDNISVDSAIAELKASMTEIGTDRAHTKPYAINLKEIENLEEEKRKILLEKDNYESYLEKRIELNNMLEIEEKNLSDLKDNLLKVERFETVKILQEAEILSDEIINLQSKIERLSIYSKISMDDYREGISLSNSIDFIDTNIIESKTELQKIEDRLESIDNESNKNFHENQFEEITRDYNKYEEMEEEKNIILYNKEDSSLEFLKRDYQSYKDKNTKYKIIVSLTAMAAIVFLVMGLLLLCLPFFALVLLFSINFIKVKKSMEEVLVKIKDIQNIEKEKQSRINKIEEIQRSLLIKYNVKSKIEFKRLLDKIQIESYRKKENIELYNELISKKQSLINRIADNESNKKQNSIKLEDIFCNNNVKDLKEFSDSLDKKSLYEKNLRELETKKDLLRRVLGENTIDSLVTKLDNHYLEINDDVKIMDKNQLKYQIDKARENISDLKIALSGVEENLNILGKNISRLVEIEEELHRKMIYKKELDLKLKSLELAAQTIEELSKDIHSQFAPAINKKVSEIVETITDGKYTNIKISESLNISIENPITKEIIEIDNLSGGTIDQLYFSLRFGIINSMVGDRLPLILDDCFIQYDDIRLRNIIKFLAKIGSERQVLLFTCHNREKEILNGLGVEFNLINLT